MTEENNEFGLEAEVKRLVGNPLRGFEDKFQDVPYSKKPEEEDNIYQDGEDIHQDRRYWI